MNRHVVVGLRFICLALLVSVGIIGRLEAQVLYGATGSNGVDGQLVTINTTTGSATVVGSLVDGSSNPYGITGLSFHPTNGVLYGATTPQSTTAPASLVIINPSNGQVTPIGSFGLPGGTFGDIAFDKTTGILYGTRSNGGANAGNLYTINLATGVSTLVGPANITTGSAGHGLASTSTGTIFTVPDAANLYTFNKVTGAATQIAIVSGGPFTQNINAMDFNSADVLFGVNTDNNNPAVAHLVTLDTTTGVISDIGASINNLDGISFQTVAVPEPATVVMLGLCIAGLGTYCWQRRAKLHQQAQAVIETE